MGNNVLACCYVLYRAASPEANLSSKLTALTDFFCTEMQVAVLIRTLMARDSASRPTARQVLRSELVPPAVGDEQLTDLLRSLPDR